MNTRKYYAIARIMDVLLSEESIFKRIQNIDANSTFTFFKNTDRQLKLYRNLIEAKYVAADICSRSEANLNHEVHPNKYRYHTVPIYEIEIPEDCVSADPVIRNIKLFTDDVFDNPKSLSKLFHVFGLDEDGMCETHCRYANPVDVVRVIGVHIFHEDVKAKYISLEEQEAHSALPERGRCIML